MKFRIFPILIVLNLLVLSIFFISCNHSSAHKKIETNSDSLKNLSVKIGVALYSFNHFSFEEAVRKSKSTGVNYVEGFSFHELGESYRNERIANLPEQDLLHIKEILDSNKIKMVSMYADAKTLAEWEQLFRQGKRLGLEFLVGEPDISFLDDINRLAGENNIKFAIHEHAKGISKYWHPDSALTAIKDRGNLKICADIGHWVRSGLDPVECLKKLEGNIISLHVKDLDSFGNINAKDVNISTGIVEYPKVMAELNRQAFSGYIFIECEHDWENNLKDVQESVNYITKISQE